MSGRDAPRTFQATWFAEPAEGGGDTVEVPLEASQAPDPAERVGAYTLHGVLGEGGMGVVYDAEQQHPRRRVALKLIKPEQVTDEARGRFHHEAHLLGRLLHPGIPQIYEAGDADGQLYLAMEKVDGPPLDAWAEGRSLRERLTVLARIADAVHHAHLRGILHRDLKPGNILVAEGGQPKVLDFGIAATLGSRRKSGRVAGTPAFMAPEQLDGRGDARVDVYALGVTAYRVLTGVLPLEVPTTTAREVRAFVLGAEPVPASTHDRRLRGDLDAILARALQKDPDHRYPSAADLAADLRRALAHEPVQARDGGALYRLDRLVRRHPLPASALALVVLVLAGATAVLGVQLRQVSAARLRAEAASREAAAARDALQRRTDALTLRQARDALATDPAATLAWLATLSDQADWAAAGALVHQARAAGASLRTLEGHAGVVRAVALSPDGRTAWTGGYDDRLLAWDLRAPTEPAREVARHEADITGLHPVEGGVVAAGRAGVVRWHGGGEDRELARHAGEVEAMVVAGDLGVSADDRGEVRAWTLDGTPRGEVRMEAPIQALAVDPDDQIWLGDDAGGVWRWTPGRAPVLAWRHAAGVTALSGDPVVSAAEDGSVRQGRADDGVRAHDAPVRGIHVASDGRWLTTDRVGVLQVWTAGGVPGPTWSTDGGVIRDAAWSADGRVVVGSEDGAVRVWDPDSGRRYTLRGHAGRIRDLHVLGDRALTGAEDGTARLWTLEPPPVDRLNGHDGAITALVGTEEATFSGGEDGVVWRWDPATGQGERWTIHDAGIEALLTLPDGRVVSGDRAGEVRVGERVGQAGDKVRRLVAVGEGRFVAAATSRPVVTLFEADTLRGSALEGHARKVEDATADREGRLITAGADGSVRRWSPEGESTVLLTLPIPATAVRVLPEGTVVVGDQRGHLHVGDGEPLPAHQAAVTAIVPLPDGGFASGAADGTILLHPTGIRIEAHRGPVAALAVAEGALWSTGGRTLARWELATGAGGVVLAGDAPLFGLTRVGDRLVLGEGAALRTLPLGLPRTARGVRQVLAAHGLLPETPTE